MIEFVTRPYGNDMKNGHHYRFKVRTNILHLTLMIPYEENKMNVG